MSLDNNCFIELHYDKDTEELILLETRRHRRYKISSEKSVRQYELQISESNSVVLVWITASFKIKYLLLTNEEKTNLSQVIIDKADRYEIPDEFVHRHGTIAVSWLDAENFIIAFENQFSQIAYIIGNINGTIVKSYVDNSDVRLSRSVMHSPKLVFDGLGRCWLMFIDSFRRAVLGSRWLGEKFGEIFVLASIRQPTMRWEEIFSPIEKFDVNETDVTAFALNNSSCSCHFSTEQMLNVNNKRKILMFDLAEFVEIKGFNQCFFSAKKYADNPIFTPSDELPFESLRVFNFGRVIRETNEHYRIWYSAMGKPEQGNNKWWEWLKVGHAVSKDGINWTRQGMSSEASHLMEGLPYMPALFIDDADELSPYKILTFDTYQQQLEDISDDNSANKSDIDSFGTNQIKGTLWKSPDGFQWTSKRVSLTFRNLPRPLSFIPQCVIRTDSNEWRAYGFSSLTLGRRACAMAYSRDLEHWHFYEDNPILASEFRGTPLVLQGPESQIHDTIVWKYEGYYLALYQYQYGPDQHDVELAISRDGKSFQFVGINNKLIRRGDAGQWDRGSIVPTVPIVLDDVIRIYYGGSDYYHFSDGKYTYERSDNMKVACGLAELRRDGFCGLKLNPNKDGSILTVPIKINAQQKAKTHYMIYINADCGRDGKILVELTDLTGKPILGYSKEECIPISQDSTKQLVRWKTKSSISINVTFRIKFYGYAGIDALTVYGIDITRHSET